jgi:hypothetical protein
VVRTLSFLWMVSSLAVTMLGTPAKASTWHSEITVDGFYCADGSRRAHLAQCNGGLGNGGGPGPRTNGGGQGPGQPNAALRQACGDDARKFCAAVIQDLEARRACMRAHQADLSSACKAAIANQFHSPAAREGN